MAEDRSEVEEFKFVITRNAYSQLVLEMLHVPCDEVFIPYISMYHIIRMVCRKCGCHLVFNVYE